MGIVSTMATGLIESFGWKISDKLEERMDKKKRKENY